MLWLVTFVLISLLAAVSYQDIKDRMVSVWIFPMIFIAAFLRGWILLRTTDQLVRYLLINLNFILFLFVIILVFYFLKEKRISVRQLFEDKIGLGDLLFFFSITPLFYAVNFILFFTTGLLIVLLITLFITSKQTIKRTIPLAGELAILTCVLLVFSTAFQLDLYSDNWLGTYSGNMLTHGNR